MKRVEGFDERLRKAVANRSMTYHQVSLLTGIPWNCFNSYLNEGRMPCCLYLVKMAKILKVSTDYLLGLKEDV